MNSEHRLNSLKEQLFINKIHKYQFSLVDAFVKKLLREKRITKEELKEYFPKRKKVEEIIKSKLNEKELPKGKR